MNWVDCATDKASDVGASAFTGIVNWLTEGLGKLVGTVMTWWVKIPTPSLEGNGNGVKGDPVGWIWLHTGWITTWIAVLCLLVAAGRMAVTRRGEAAVEAAKGMLTLTVVTAASVGGFNLLAQASDAFSEWIISEAYSGQEFGEAVVGWLGLSMMVGFNGPVIALILALIATLACIAQVGLMMVRTAMLVLLVGTLPLSAAASATPAGQAWFRKSIGWLIAFILYKPAAAIVYATAIRMTAIVGDGEADSGTMLMSICGIMLMILALVALPALMRFTTPLVQAAGSGGGGGGAAAGAGRAVATGAKRVGQMRNSSSGPPPPSGPKPPVGARTAPGGTSTLSKAGSVSTTAKATGGVAVKGASAAAGPVGVAVAVTAAAVKGAQGAARNAVDKSANGGPDGSK
ncbi:hypothetical protein MHW47_08915 [Streptomyces sp. OfavH-34-F]|uniref:hypothetical protein n=1 Tax=Streptomyces sp. OfavH-34-F TaxID=2917760 RepID=UPI001EF1E2BF|nr:hypothetical protein [Streptomyces sp. OfavH-34-F]MCG7524555.1 hypothetical protein [Streptomyces sp. OfavH-34-F]